MNTKAIVLHSGGLDSTVCLLQAKRKGREVMSLSIDYPAPTVQTLPPTTPSAPPLDPGKSKSPPKPKKQSSASMAHFTQVLKHLREHPRNRPASETTLARHLQTVLGNKIAEAGVVAIVQELVRTKLLTIDTKNKVTYHL